MVCCQQTTYWFRQNFLSLFRWSVVNRPPIDFVRIFFLYLFIIIIYFYFFPFFVPRITHSLVWSIWFNFSTVIGHCHDLWPWRFSRSSNHRDVIQAPFCEITLSIISSWCISKGHSYSYHIYFRSRVNRSCHQRSHKGHDARVCARQNLKLLKITKLLNESTNQVILSISKFSVRKCPRARCARSQRAEKVKFKMFTWFGFLLT